MSFSTWSGGVLSGILVVVSGGCAGGAREAEALRAEVLMSLAEHVALAHYVDFADRAEQLSTLVDALCRTPTNETLAAAREAWWAAHEPWKRVEVVQFGPVVEYPERLGPKIDDWPVNADAVEEMVSGEGALDQETFDGMGSATRGLPVVEYLMWGAGDQTLEILSSDTRRCASLVGVAADVRTNATRLVDAWESDWLVRLGSPDPETDDMYDMPQDVIDEWVNRMGFTVENIRSTKLGKPLGDSAGGDPHPDALESRFSGRSLEDARDALAGSLDVWTGDVGEEEHPGVVDLVVDDDVLVRHVSELFEASRVRLAQIPETLEQTAELEPEVVVPAQEALRALQVGIQVDLAQALGVTITFNDNDGD